MWTDAGQRGVLMGDRSGPRRRCEWYPADASAGRREHVMSSGSIVAATIRDALPAA